jgi:hypothetical protein
MSYFLVSDWLYYTDYYDNQNLYRVRVDGSDCEKILDDTFGHNVVGEWIYYHVNNDDFSMNRIRTDGTRREKIKQKKE